MKKCKNCTLEWIKCHPLTMAYIALISTMNFILEVLGLFH